MRSGGLGKKTLIIRIYDLKEFDKKMLEKALKLIENREEIVEVEKLSENSSKEK